MTLHGADWLWVKRNLTPRVRDSCGLGGAVLLRGELAPVCSGMPWRLHLTV